MEPLSGSNSCGHRHVSSLLWGAGSFLSLPLSIFLSTSQTPSYTPLFRACLENSNALQSIHIERGGLVSFPLQSIWIGRDWVYPNKLLGFHHGITGGQFLSLLLAFAEQYLHSDIAAICLSKHGMEVTQLNKVEPFLISTNSLRYSANITLNCSLPSFFERDCSLPTLLCIVVCRPYSVFFLLFGN